jgi:hypothetical protein
MQCPQPARSILYPQCICRHTSPSFLSWPTQPRYLVCCTPKHACQLAATPHCCPQPSQPSAGGRCCCRCCCCASTACIPAAGCSVVQRALETTSQAAACWAAARQLCACASLVQPTSQAGALAAHSTSSWAHPCIQQHSRRNQPGLHELHALLRCSGCELMRKAVPTRGTVVAPSCTKKGFSCDAGLDAPALRLCTLAVVSTTARPHSRQACALSPAPQLDSLSKVTEGSVRELWLVIC